LQQFGEDYRLAIRFDGLPLRSQPIVIPDNADTLSDFVLLAERGGLELGPGQPESAQMSCRARSAIRDQTAALPDLLRVGGMATEGRALAEPAPQPALGGSQSLARGLPRPRRSIYLLEIE
jgi:hypothetical protein